MVRWPVMCYCSGRREAAAGSSRPIWLPAVSPSGWLDAAAGATTDVRTIDLGDAASLAEAIAGVGVVLSTIGPFARQAGPVIDACLAAGVSYVDIANEWAAVRGLLDRDEEARTHAVALVTGAGFG